MPSTRNQVQAKILRAAATAGGFRGTVGQERLADAVRQAAGWPALSGHTVRSYLLGKRVPESAALVDALAKILKLSAADRTAWRRSIDDAQRHRRENGGAPAFESPDPP